MGPKQWIDFLKGNWATVVVIAILLAPVIWGAATLYYAGRVETLREQVSTLKVQVDALREQKTFLELKLKAPAEFTADTGVASSAGVQSSAVTGTPNAPESAQFRYPPISDASRPSRSDVEQLAKFYGLFTEWKVNPHLRFKSGDVSYFFEQGLSEAGLKREFESRRLVLERADKSGQRIGSPGDLSHLAEQLQGEITGLQ